MRILVIAPYVPWPLHGGNQLRIFHLLHGLRRAGHSLTLVAGGDAGVDYAATPLGPLCERIEAVPTVAGPAWPIALRSLVSRLPYPFQRFVTRQLRARVAGLLAKASFDVVLVNVAIMAAAVPPTRGGASIVLDEGESQELVWQERARSGPFPRRLFSLLNRWKVRRVEAKLLERADAVVAVSEDEADHLRRRVAGGIKVWVVPNGVDSVQLQPSAALPVAPPRIMFCGNFSVRRNIEAAVWLVRSVFPRVRRSVPDAEFWLVGATPAAPVRRLARNPGVHVTGTVEDVRPFYAAASVIVAPYHFGRGTKLKVLEALAMGRPVVSTSVGIRGIDAQPDEHFLLADDPQAFADAVVRAITDKELSKRLSKLGRRLVESKYSWEPIVDQLEARLRGLLAHNRVSASGSPPSRNAY